MESDWDWRNKKLTDKLMNLIKRGQINHEK